MIRSRDLTTLGADARAAAGAARALPDREALLRLAERAEALGAKLAARTAELPAAGLPAEPTDAMVEAGRKVQRVSAERFRAGYRAAAAAFAEEGAAP
jgi:hypothetical protein